jgi:GTP 3',8-cyclase
VTLIDKFGRPITDLRISITDRCNYKCVYCRTGNEGALYGDLPFADYLRMARVLVGMGITKIRITGGEPLLRKGVVEFVRELAKLHPRRLEPQSSSGGNSMAEEAAEKVGKADSSAAEAARNDKIRGLIGTSELVPFPKHARNRVFSAACEAMPLDIAITTNGHLLAEMAQPLKDAGLNRVTVSMDAVDPDRFARITRVPNGYDHVLAGIRAARSAGLWPVKINCVLMRGFNEDQIMPFGLFAREEGVVVRFIEFMPLEEDRVWAPETVITLDEILRRMAEYRPLVEIAHSRSETARRYRFYDGVGEIGIIAPVSHPFCGHCSRIRITSDGQIRTCLFSVWDHDLYGLMRRGASDEELVEFIRGVVQRKEERHHIGEPDFVPASRTMVHIGG